MVIDRSFWRGRRVFLTGHTGFKGAWLSLMLRELGAEVSGYALAPENDQSLFSLAGIERDLHHTLGDVRDLGALRQAMQKARPEIVLHMAAQSLVRPSYEDPVTTYSTNVMGTVNLLEAVRQTPSVSATVIVTSDKCYENSGLNQAFREIDRLGGDDPYSNSKGCAELVTAAYRKSYFPAGGFRHVASARAGNVIGGGDWAVDRLVPDAIRAFLAGNTLSIRSPDAIRPWQHVIDPLMGYMALAQQLTSRGAAVAEGWNFGPGAESDLPVRNIVDGLVQRWGGDARWSIDRAQHPHEAAYLRLDCVKAHVGLGWTPSLSISQALDLTVEWYRVYEKRGDVRAASVSQIWKFFP